MLSAGTLLAGRSEHFVTPVWIRFGNPGSVKVIVGGVALQMTHDAPGDLIAGPDAGTATCPDVPRSSALSA